MSENVPEPRYIEYYLRRGDTVNANALMTVTDNMELKLFDACDHKANINYEDYKVSWDYKKGETERPYIVIEESRLRAYAESIMDKGYGDYDAGCYDATRSNCLKCGSSFPYYWIYEEPLCPFCGEEHGLVYEESN